MMNKIALGAAGLAVLAAGAGAYFLQQSDRTRVESLCAATTSDAAEAARAQTLALVDVVERGRFVDKGNATGVQTFKARTLAVFKGALPAETEIGLPEGAAAQVEAGGRYEVSVMGPEEDVWLARFTRAVPAAADADTVGAHWKQEIERGFVEAPCTDTTTGP
ncbi:hypothetical protein ABZ621_31495 [Streptomyces sp. NPDC007863]|uniref:hypothetical protein n=1 Tax=Streptomyces sp. NPDC007863 TaxID=3154894 RepID=UPI0033EDDBE2